jgi:phospholipid-binding lipoprotein MlaA
VPHRARCDRRRSRPRAARAAILGAAVALGCATSPERQEIRDTLEPLNRPVFGVNEQVDEHALGPVARGWKRITPEPVRDSISNAYRNLTFPQRFVSTLGQAELRMAGVELTRFVLNSTIGVAGLFDPASRLGLGRYDESIGTMLARWRVPPGPYLVIPILGPSTPRDAFGGLVGLALNPLVWTGVGVPGLGAVFAINGRAQADEEIEIARQAALDYYLFVRESYVQQQARAQRNEYVTRDDAYELPPDVVVVPGDVVPGAPCDAPGGVADDRC